jgi:hypothetical protein
VANNKLDPQLPYEGLPIGRPSWFFSGFGAALVDSQVRINLLAPDATTSGEIGMIYPLCADTTKGKAHHRVYRCSGDIHHVGTSDARHGCGRGGGDLL